MQGAGEGVSYLGPVTGQVVRDAVAVGAPQSQGLRVP